jgi:hypothetical protein
MKEPNVLCQGLPPHACSTSCFRTYVSFVEHRTRFKLDLDVKKVYFEPMERNESILKLSQADEERELEFELNYLASLTFEERLKMMRQKSREMLRQMVEHGHRRPFEILKRT